MTDREKLIQIIDSSRTYVANKASLADHLLANGVRLEYNQATSDKTSEEQPEEIDFDYAAEDDNG